MLRRLAWYARIMDTDASTKRYIIDTASGVRLDLDDPRPENIKIEDVAGGLSKVCRFGAQPLEYYSVAQHALLVRQLVVKAGYRELALIALHHDSHEAYLCDIPKPLKSKISADTDVYDDASKRFDRAIAEAFGFKWPEEGSPEQAVIKGADRQALLIEAARLLPDGGEALRQDLGLGDEEYRNLATLDDPLSPAEAENLFLEAHAGLTAPTPQRP
jgi:5'-deoxynucleotidase YfbR-like HD superfamily hydrolase